METEQMRVRNNNVVFQFDYMCCIRADLSVIVFVLLIANYKTFNVKIFIYFR